MTDSIEDSDVRRVDANTDPTALTDDEIEDAMPDDFSSEAKQAFADRVSQARSEVRESVDLSKRIDQNPASGDAMIRNESGQFAANADDVTGTRLEDDGGYYADLSDGSSVRIDTVDLQAGGKSNPASRADRGDSDWETANN